MGTLCAGRIGVLEKGDLIFYRSGTKGQISANKNPVNHYKVVLLLSETVSDRCRHEKLRNWIGALLIIGMLGELSRSRDEEKRKELYLLARSFLVQNPVSFENRILQIYERYILESDYESRWYDGDRGHLWQLRLFSGEIKSVLAGYRDICLWGRGKRGEAFQQFCREEGIALSGVTDIQDSDIGGITGYGNRIFATREILEKEPGMIVASNRKIYGYLKKKTGCHLLNLEEFCPI